jgi:hypothetical protein
MEQFTTFVSDNFPVHDSCELLTRGVKKKTPIKMMKNMKCSFNPL